MDDRKMVDEFNDKNEWEELDLEVSEEVKNHDEKVVEEQVKRVRRAATYTDEKKLSDAKEYPEDPFSYFEKNKVNVQLSSGTFRYEVTDFVLPGRDGFDLSIARCYDSGRANLVDMIAIKNNLGLRTHFRKNDHNIRTYGLGVGWSFVLPSIETIPYREYMNYGVDPEEGEIYLTSYYNYDYALHLEDGRSIKIKVDQFDDYTLEDVKIVRQTGTIKHPVRNISKNYLMMVEYKNGNKDYFSYGTIYGLLGINEYVPNYKLVARQDRFGNMICFDLNDYGEMTIIDTWGRELMLRKNAGHLVWTLPGDTQNDTYEVSYEIEYEGEKPLKLTASTDLIGSEIRYEYYNTTEFTGKMRCMSKKKAGNETLEKDCEYMLLKNVRYPNGLLTEFYFGRTNNKIRIKNKVDGYIDHFPLLEKIDKVVEDEYNRVAYSYQVAREVNGKKGYIESATVTEHGDIEAKYQFDEDGQMSRKEVSYQEILVSQTAYGYHQDHKHLMISAVDQTFGKDHSNMLEKETLWTYSDDKMANLTQETVTYAGDSASNQETTIEYDDFNMVTETKRKKDANTTIKETNEYSERRLTCRRIFEVKESNGKEVEILKEKTVFEYTDTNNPNCVTSEKQYFLMGNGDLESSSKFVETNYTYNAAKFTHQFVTKKRNGIEDADKNRYDPIMEVFDYDNWGRMISKTDARGFRSTMSYDNLGRIVEERQVLSADKVITNRTDYNDSSSYITKTDANQQKMRIQYTPLGKVSQVYLAVAKTPAPGDIVLQDFRYNLWGELEEVTTYDGNGTSKNNIRKTECYTYDSFGRVLTHKIPQVGYEETYHYDEVFSDTTEAGGKLYYREQKTIKGDEFAPDVVTELYKDQKGQVRKEFLAGKPMVTYEYDKVGNNIRKTDALNTVERHEYDYAGRIVQSIRKDAGQDRIICAEYDALGNKRFTWDEADNKSEYQYDAAGRLIQVIAPFDHRAQTVKYYYDAGGNVTCEKKKQDSGWSENRNAYDARNRLTDTYQYLSATDWIRTSYQYDVMDRMTQMRTGDTPTGNGTQVTKYTYDRFGNVLTITDARGCTEYYQYDKIGRLQKKTDRNGNQTIYQYDALDRPVKESVSSRSTDGMLISDREYAYGKSGQRIREVSRETLEGNQTLFLETKYHYNNKGQLVRQEDPGNAVKDYAYDILGNRLSFQLKLKGQAAPNISLYYSYDDLYRLKQVRKNSSSGTVLAEYEYDERGNRKTLRYPQTGIEAHYTYNKASRVMSLKNQRQGTVISSWEYGYDVDGNMVSKTDNTSSTSSKTSYRYDRLGRLIEEDIPGWKRTFYTYDAYSNRIKMMVEGKTKDELVSVTSYEYGLNNWLNKEIRKQGKVTETWQYRYDNNGNETFRIWEKTAPTPDYPGNVKLSGSWKHETPTVYERRYYNGFHQLIRIDQDDKEITYQYRGDSLRHSCGVRNLSESQGKTNIYYWDGMNIVAEQTDKESVKSYLRGINLIAREMDNVLYYYIINEHGDVAQLYGSSGTCKAAYVYDAFGNEKTPSKEDDNPFRYCGEYYDLSSSTYYLRARNYRASTGRFASEDPIRDGLNWYAYCSNNPVLKSDPSGLYEVYDPHARSYVDIADPVEASRYSTNPYEKLRILVESQGWTMYEGMSLEDIYYINMSPMSDGMAAGIYNTHTNIDLDFWYPLTEHKELFNIGVEYSMLGKVALYAGASAGDMAKSQTSSLPEKERDINRTSGSSGTPKPRLKMKLDFFGHKKDIKMVDDVAREMGVDRNLLREYIHEMKDYYGMKANQNFTYDQLKDLAKDLK